MKKIFILIGLLLVCSSGLFAKTYHHHHHRGERIYTGETTITPEKVGKIKDICFKTRDDEVTIYPEEFGGDS